LILRNLPINSPVFGKVLLTFCRNVPRFKICSYDQFKRKAYDADFTVKAFSNYLDGQAFYEICSDIDESEYLYQQAALYFSRKHKYTIAFDWIDKARNFTSFNRFSIDNTYAIILFEANIHIEDNDGSVKQLLLESLDILQNCYKNDRRKLVHARTLAISLLQYIDVYGSSDVIQYIELAYDWLLTEAVSRDTGARQKVKLNGLIQRLKVYIY
jgi:hypothetical protein